MNYPDKIESPREILDYWATKRTTLTDFLKQLPENELFTPPAAGGWSAGQIADHIMLSQMGVARTVPIVLKGKFGADSDGPDFPRRGDRDYAEIRQALARPTGAKNPDPVTPADQKPLEVILAELEKSQSRLEKNTGGKTIEELRARGYEHPFFGQLNLLEWMWTMALHEEMHIQAMLKKYR